MNIVADRHSKKGLADCGFPSSVLTALITPLRARRWDPSSASPSIRRNCNFGIIVLLVIFLLLIISKPVSAANLSCENRYVTLVNPVRGRNLWSDQSLKPVEDQYQVVASHQFAATWLLQYDTLKDRDLLATMRGFDNRQEKGVFLEVSEVLAKDARVLYPQQTPWFKPNAVFLSGYSKSERRKLIDQLFWKFRDIWGYYPKSIGAWWIDSYSLQYMRQKYGITGAMIVADQLSTDNYGVWGQWWGVAFYPAKANVLTPASDISNKQPVAIIQWAQRDPLRSYGDSKSFSNFSIQANDYSSQGLNADYFKEITSVYLDCSHPVGQITVGLETGQESVGYINEYNRQLDYLKTLSQVRVVGMTDFAGRFAETYPQFPKKESLNYLQSQWNLTTSSRSNTFLHDLISYNQSLSFADYFVADKGGFLDRKLPLKNQPSWYFPFWIVAGIGGIFFLKRKKIAWVGAAGFLFPVSSYGLLLHSFYQYGWKVYFGPVVEWLPLIQVSLVLIGFGVILGWWWWIIKKFSIVQSLIFLPVLVFGLDQFLEFIRFTKLEGESFLGFLTDPYHLIGFEYGKHFQLMNRDFSLQVAAAFLKFDFQKIWSNTGNWLIIYPLVHLILALVLTLILNKLPKNIRIGIMGILVVFWMVFLFNLLDKDPLTVSPVTGSGLLGLLQ